MEEQNELDRRKATEEPDVEAHAHGRRPRTEDAADEAKSDDKPDVEAHMKVRRP